MLRRTSLAITISILSVAAYSTSVYATTDSTNSKHVIHVKLKHTVLTCTAPDPAKPGAATYTPIKSKHKHKVKVKTKPKPKSKLVPKPVVKKVHAQKQKPVMAPPPPPPVAHTACEPTVCPQAQFYKDSGANVVTTANLEPGTEVSITALALKPAASNLNYAIYNKALPLQSPGWRETELRPGYSAAFALGIRYIPHSMPSNDLNLTWTHMNSQISTSQAADGVNYFVGPDYQIGPDAVYIRNASAHAVFKYDVVNLDAGQYVDFGRNVEMRFFAGLSAGFLREEIKTIFSGVEGANLDELQEGPFSTQSDMYSSFSGMGPRVGFNLSYHTDNGFGVLGEAAVSALIGTSHTSTNFLSASQTLVATYQQATNAQTITDQNNMQVIPGLDAKLGVEYKHHYRGTLFTIQLGYQTAVYINAINQYLPGSLVANKPLQSGGIFVETMSHTQSNYSVHGPFLRFAIEF